MKKSISLLAMVLSVLLLSGCMYPDSERAGSQVPYEEQLSDVQNAVDRYRETTGGLLPIKTRDEDVDQYIKYPVDFSKIVPSQLAEIPPNAFEQGGIFQYVLMDVEEEPAVKLVDLRIAEKIRELNIRRAANGYAPIAEVVADNVYKLNYTVMGYDEEQYVESPYSGRSLPLVVSGEGEIYVDYSMDLYTALQEYDGELEPGEDIRFLLYEESALVPAYSLPYTVDENREPVFLAD